MGEDENVGDLNLAGAVRDEVDDLDVALVARRDGQSLEVGLRRERRAGLRGAEVDADLVTAARLPRVGGLFRHQPATLRGLQHGTHDAVRVGHRHEMGN